MERPNTSLIRRGLDAFARRDLDTWLECFHPGVQVAEDSSVTDAGSYSGREGLMRWLHVMERNWEQFQVYGEAFNEIGDDVVALTRVRGIGRRSGIEIDGRFGSIFTVRSGQVVAWRIFAGWDAAIAAAKRPAQHQSAPPRLARRRNAQGSPSSSSRQRRDGAGRARAHGGDSAPLSRHHS